MLHNATVCEPGKVRRLNQDAVLALSDNDEGLYLVADGMGGGYGGEKASALLRDEFATWWQSSRRQGQTAPFDQIIEELQDILSRCSGQILRMAPTGTVCGSTLALLWVRNGIFVILSVGDSRVYRIRPRWCGASLSLLTYDDVARPKEGWAPKEIGHLTRYVGAQEPMRGTLRTGVWDPRDILMLCSDGVYKSCPETVWGRVLGPDLRRGALDEAAQRFSARILQQGARDNFSLILVQQV